MHFDVKKTRRWEDTTREVGKKPALSLFSGARLAVEIVQEMEKRRKAEVQAKEEKAIAGSNGLGLLQDAVALREIGRGRLRVLLNQRNVVVLVHDLVGKLTHERRDGPHLCLHVLCVLEIFLQVTMQPDVFDLKATSFFVCEGERGVLCRPDGSFRASARWL